MIKTFLILLLFISSGAHAAVIQLNLTTQPTFNIRASDGNFTELSNGPSDPIQQVNYTKTVRIDETTASSPLELVSEIPGLFTQFATNIDYSDFFFDNFSPFLNTFNAFTPTDLTSNLNDFTQTSQSLDLQFFYNEVFSPGFEGGDVSIRFSETYELLRDEGGDEIRESLFLSGRIFFDRISSNDEYNQARTASLTDVLTTQSVRNVEYGVLHSIEFVNNFCGAPCSGLLAETSRFGASFGTAEILTVSTVYEPPTFFIIVSAMIFGFLRRAQSLKVKKP